MNCYLCEIAPKPGGTRYGIRSAVGICQHCGIGVCMEHSAKSLAPGSPLFCKACAELAEQVPIPTGIGGSEEREPVLS
jgi:hypothetical protein